MDTELIRLLKLAQGERSLNAFARHADISPGNLSRIMNGQKATPETLKKIANKAHNNVTYRQLMIAAGYITESTSTEDISINETQPKLSKKDERDIKKDLNKTLEQLEKSQDGLMFDGEPMDDETRELLRISLENSMRIAKHAAKKYTPKKYRK